MKFPGVTSNWEFVVWHLINSCVSASSREFSRTQMLRRSYDQVYNILIILGHKKRPAQMEATIQRTLQNMRDKSWITFFGQGDYRVTDAGYAELLRNKENIEKINRLDSEQLKLLAAIASS